MSVGTDKLAFLLLPSCRRRLMPIKSTNNSTDLNPLDIQKLGLNNTATPLELVKTRVKCMYPGHMMLLSIHELRLSQLLFRITHSRERLQQWPRSISRSICPRRRGICCPFSKMRKNGLLRCHGLINSLCSISTSNVYFIDLRRYLRLHNLS